MTFPDQEPPAPNAPTAGGFFPILPLTLAAGEPAPPATEPPVIAVYGDSFTAGPAGGSWLTTIGVELGATTVNMALSGTGYVRAAGSTFPYAVTVDPVPGAALVIVMGSQNDRDEEPFAVRLAAVVTYEAIRRASPSARLLVVGGYWPWSTPPSTNALAIRDAVRDVCRHRGIPFLDPIAERWLHSRPGLIGSDGQHPTVLGQQAIADRVRPHVAAALAR